MHMLWEYHGERWPVLLTDIIKNALRAAYLSTSIQDYLTLSFEALGPSTTFTKDQQTVVYANITNILQVKILVFRIIFIYLKNILLSHISTKYLLRIDTNDFIN